MSGFRIDQGGRRLATAGHRVGIFLLDDYTVLDDLGGRRWHLAPWRRRGRRHRRFFRGAAGQEQTEREANFPHPVVFALSEALVDGNLGYTSEGRSRSSMVKYRRISIVV